MAATLIIHYTDGEHREIELGGPTGAHSWKPDRSGLIVWEHGPAPSGRGNRQVHPWHGIRFYEVLVVGEPF